MTKSKVKPSYQEVVDYYLRDDVLEYLWKLSQTRLLKFFHHCKIDPKSKTSKVKPKAVKIFSPISIEALRWEIKNVTQNVPSYSYDFFPFWGMQGCEVYNPDIAGRFIGYDLRYEFDFDLKNSFAVLLPVAAIFEAYNIPIVLKYSGHRSLHLIIPAESFPLSMKNKRYEEDREDWAVAIERLGNLIYRIAPYVSKTHVDLSKEMTLTAPYSFHRYFGLIGKPMQLSLAFDFQPNEASLDKITEIKWPFPDYGCDGKGMLNLLNIAKKAQSDSKVIFEIAEKSFQEAIWDKFLQQQLPEDIPTDSLLGVIMSGVVGIQKLNQFSGDRLDRLKFALLAIDNPIGKTHKFSGLVHADLAYNQPMSNFVEQRRIRAEILAVWVESNISQTLNRLLKIATDAKFASPILLATRLCEIIPENSEILIEELVELWNRKEEMSIEKQVFLSLALGERIRNNGMILNLLNRFPKESITLDFKKQLLEADEWRAETHPIQALMVLVLVFGESIVQSWVLQQESETSRLILKSVFNNRKGKLIHSAKRLGLIPNNS